MSSKLRSLILCLVVCVTIMSVLSNGGNYVNAVSHSSSSGSWSHTWTQPSGSNTWTHGSWSHTWSNTWSHTWSNTWSRTYNGGNYYNGGSYYGGNYYNGGYYPYQNYCNPYSGYNCPYSPSSPYQGQTATTTFTQQNYVTDMITSTASVMVANTFTSIVMVPTVDDSAITFYGIIIVVLLILLGAFVFISMFLLSKFKVTPAH